jgi:hypothetical protein
MGDDKLLQSLKLLDSSLNLKSAEASRWANDVNAELKRLSENPPPPKQSLDAYQLLDNAGLRFIGELVKEKGIRLRALEEAIRADKVVVGPPGTPDLTPRLLEVLEGRKPLAAPQLSRGVTLSLALKVQL